MPRRPPLRTAMLTALALCAFAANSWLCRAALGAQSIGPAAFSAIRIASGALALLMLVAVRERARPPIAGSWRASVMLCVYVVGFSYAYVDLATGTGALILFGCVQLTMMARALWQGERPRAGEWLGIAMALAGLVWLVFPGLTAPSPLGASLMAAAGVGWGAYTLIGRGSRAPLTDTAGNFTRALVPVLLASALALGIEHASTTGRGALLAVASGALTSGGGYALWFAVLPELTRTRAALLQLAVPVLAALAGVVMLGETITVRLVLAMLLVLGGVGVAVRARS